MSIQADAAGVAADIREHGHFQESQGDHWRDLYPCGAAKCCLFCGPTASAINSLELREALGRSDLVGFSETSTTDVVLAALDAVAMS